MKRCDSLSSKELFDPKDYKDIFDFIPLSYDELTNPVKTYKYVSSNLKVEYVEKKLHLPLMVRPMYAFLFENKRIPKQYEYVNYYLDFNDEYYQDFFKKNIINDNIKDGVKARLVRTYPSLVRDICFNKYVKDHAKDFTTIYDMALDVSKDIDLMMYNETGYYGICLYTDTPRAKEARTKKQFRHTRFTNVNYVEILEPPKKFIPNKISLYGEEEFQLLKKTIEDCRNKKFYCD